MINATEKARNIFFVWLLVFIVVVFLAVSDNKNKQPINNDVEYSNDFIEDVYIQIYKLQSRVSDLEAQLEADK